MFYFHEKYKKIKSENRTEENNSNNISSDFRFSSIVVELVFDDDRKNITSTIDYKMTVLAETATEIKRDLIWSGSQYNGTKIIQMNGNYELIDSQRNTSPYPYTILFNEEKKRGDKIEFKTETSVTDGNLDMLPMYSFAAKYQIDKLTLIVIAPKGIIKNVKKSVYADRTKEICIKNPTKLNGDLVRDLVKYTYEIQTPSLLYNYFIEWEFTKP